MSKTKKKQIPKLTGKQVRFLRGLGHHLKPLVLVGREEITDKLISSVEAVLNTRELIKVKVQNNCAMDRKEVAEALSSACGAAVAQVLGRTILLYRENPDLDNDKRLKLPS